MAKIEFGWPDTELEAQKPLTKDEMAQHRQAVYILFGGSLVGYVAFAYLVGAPPLRLAVAKTWHGVLAFMQWLW
jgi:hypothetical protein